MALAARPYSYRHDPAVPAFVDDRPVIVFDGVCVLCSAWARFVIRHDGDKRFRLLAAQSPLGVALYRHYGLDPVDYETNLLIEEGLVYVKSEGSIRMFERLGWPWAAVRVARLLPLQMRDRLYQLVARNRYRLFGRRDTCLVPAPEDRDRFL